MSLQQMTFFDEPDVHRGGVTCISGGFPFQPHSVAGKQMGEKDERHLWPEFMRIVRELRPRAVVGENVPGILSTIHDAVCADLEAEGYEVWTLCVPAYAVGAHHERYRVAIVAVHQGLAGFQTDTETDPAGTFQETRQHSGSGNWAYLPGTYWAVHKPPFFGMAHGIPGGVDGWMRYKQVMTAYGNAVTPQQFYPIFRVLADILRR